MSHLNPKSDCIDLCVGFIDKQFEDQHVLGGEKSSSHFVFPYDVEVGCNSNKSNKTNKTCSQDITFEFECCIDEPGCEKKDL